MGARPLFVDDEPAALRAAAVAAADAAAADALLADVSLLDAYSQTVTGVVFPFLTTFTVETPFAVVIAAAGT